MHGRKRCRHGDWNERLWTRRNIVVVVLRRTGLGESQHDENTFHEPPDRRLREIVKMCLYFYVVLLLV